MGAGAAILALEGNERFGVTGAIVGGLIGAPIGYFVGHIPWIISSAVYARYLKKSSTVKLKRKLSEEYYVAQLLIAELVVRGEDVEQFFPHITDMLKSSNRDERIHGLRNLQIWFPRMASRLNQFDTMEETEALKDALNELCKCDPDAGPILETERQIQTQ